MTMRYISTRGAGSAADDAAPEAKKATPTIAMRIRAKRQVESVFLGSVMRGRATAGRGADMRRHQ